LFLFRFLQSSEINGPLKQRAPHAETLTSPAGLASR
jgi:hypothetical protein